MPYSPQRVVSLQPSATVILNSLGLLDRVVACTKYCADIVPEAREGRILVADSWSAKSHEILAANPELVIAAVPYQMDAVAEILKAGIAFLGLAPRTLHDIYCDMYMIAGLFGATERARHLIHDLRNEIMVVRLTAMTAGAKRRVFCEEWGKPLIASQPWVKELVEAAGGEFIGKPGKQIAAEEVAAVNPEVLVAAWCGAGNRVPLEKIVRERRWEHTHAALDKQVYCIADELLNTPAPTLLGGLHALARAIHPDLFPATEGLRRIGTPAEPRKRAGSM